MYVFCKLLCVHSSFAILLIGRFAWFVVVVSRDCCVALPRGAMGLSCDCSNSLSYSLTIFKSSCVLSKIIFLMQCYSEYQ